MADYNEAIRLDPQNEVAYAIRGSAWSRKEVYDQATADLSVAIRLDPTLFDAYAERANVWLKTKNYDRAIADFNEAIRLDPQSGFSYSGRAALYLVQCNPTTLADVRGWLEALGWRTWHSLFIVASSHLNLRRSDHSDEARQLLDEAARRCDTSIWPYPVISYLRKEIDGRALLAAAADGDKMTVAQTYIGLDLILSGREEEALPKLRWVKEHGNNGFIQYAIADAELDRIEGKKTSSKKP